MLLRQQLIEKEEEQQLKEESLHEIKSTSMKSFSFLINIKTGATIWLNSIYYATWNATFFWLQKCLEIIVNSKDINFKKI